MPVNSYQDARAPRCADQCSQSHPAEGPSSLIPHRHESRSYARPMRPVKEARNQARDSMKRFSVFATLVALWAVACGSEAQQDSGESLAEGECNATNPCPNGGTCVYSAGDCSASAKGSCAPFFQCDGPPSGPVCQCNGEVLEDPEAICQLAFEPRPDVSLCQTGTFACGSLMCKRNAEVCEVTIGGAQGSSPSYACKTPSEIGGTCTSGIPDCACLVPTACPGGGCCAADADHQETVTIMAP